MRDIHWRHVNDLPDEADQEVTGESRERVLVDGDAQEVGSPRASVEPGKRGQRDPHGALAKVLGYHGSTAHPAVQHQHIVGTQDSCPARCLEELRAGEGGHDQQ